MNFLFLRQPPEDNPQNTYAVAARSKEFAIDNARIAEEEVRRAQVRLNDAVEKHSDDTWDGERIIAAAEENLDATEARFVNARTKRRWELDDRWHTVFPRTAAAIARTKGLLLRIDWTKLRPLL